MTCPVCRGSGHQPNAPWLLCSEPGCLKAEWVRQRSEYGKALNATSPMMKAFGCDVAADEAVPPGEVHLVSGGKTVRVLGIVP